MKISCLGAGAWGFCLSTILASKGNIVHLWTGNLNIDGVLVKRRQLLESGREDAHHNIVVTSDLGEAVNGCDIVVESITSKGLRSVLEKVTAIRATEFPLVLTSKGIECESGLLMCEVATSILGSRYKIATLGGPSLAKGVMEGEKTCVMAASSDITFAKYVCRLFETSYFHVYPSLDIVGVSIGGAAKNVVAIMYSLADNLGYGENAKAALIALGSSEMLQIGKVLGGSDTTICGLAGIGDLYATALSSHSRNYIFGKLLSQGMSPEEARNKIGMVVEGENACESLSKVGEKFKIKLPIVEAIKSVIFNGADPRKTIDDLLKNGFSNIPL